MTHPPPLKTFQRILGIVEDQDLVWRVHIVQTSGHQSLDPPLDAQILFRIKILAQAVGVPVDRRSGGRLATTLVATIFIIIFFPRFFSPSSPFLIEGVLGSKNLFSESDSKCPIT